MSTRLEEQLLEKISHYEQKEKDLIERERLFELKMKEDHLKFMTEKETYQTGLNERENSV